MRTGSPTELRVPGPALPIGTSQVALSLEGELTNTLAVAEQLPYAATCAADANESMSTTLYDCNLTEAPDAIAEGTAAGTLPPTRECS